MKLKNYEIYQLSAILNDAFQQETRKFPAKVYFYILKNIKILNNLVQDIEDGKKFIIDKYNIIFSENGEILNSQEEQNLANQELNELSEVDQEVSLSLIKLSDIENLEFTAQQMEALMIMIEE